MTSPHTHPRGYLPRAVAGTSPATPPAVEATASGGGLLMAEAALGAAMAKAAKAERARIDRVWPDMFTEAREITWEQNGRPRSPKVAARRDAVAGLIGQGLRQSEIAVRLNSTDAIISFDVKMLRQEGRV